VILDAAGWRWPRQSFPVTPNLDHLSNDAENFGGLMTEVNICNAVDPITSRPECGAWYPLRSRSVGREPFRFAISSRSRRRLRCPRSLAAAGCRQAAAPRHQRHRRCATIQLSAAAASGHAAGRGDVYAGVTAARAHPAADSAHAMARSSCASMQLPARR